MADAGGQFFDVAIVLGLAGGPGATALTTALGFSDLVVPTLSGFSPPEGAALAKYDPVVFDVTDELVAGEFLVTIIVSVYIVSTDTTELAYMSGDGFENRYFSASGGITSSVAAISNGLRFTLRRRDGWPTGGIRVKVKAVDRGGNVGTL